MFQPLQDLPDGVIGFESSGEIHASDYIDTLVPAVEQAAAAEGVRLVLVFDTFDGFSSGAAWQDMKLGFDHLKAWKRTAVVTDLDWMRHLVGLFGWMSPGDCKIFELAEREAAIAWAAADD